MSKCPHKVKKGEKRSNECRCDEQGRYCCLLEPDHWETLMRLEKPGVTFFPNREALEATQHVVRGGTPATPSYYMPGTPGSIMSIPSTPAVRARQTSLLREPTTPFDSIPPSHSTLTPHFDYLGISSPVTTSGIISPDPLHWNANMSGGPFEPLTYDMSEVMQSQGGSCCQSSAPSMDHPVQAPVSSCCQPSTVEDDDDYDMAGEGSCCQRSHQSNIVPNAFESNVPFPQIDPQDPFLGASAPPAFDGMYTQPAFDFDRWVQNYQAYQMPGAICQKCGLNGCTCRSCPTLMQNQSTTSWAHGCGRAHARNMKSQPPALAQHMALSPASQSTPFSNELTYGSTAPPLPAYDFSNSEAYALDPQVLSPTHHMPEHMDMGGFDRDIGTADTADPLDLAMSEFLMSELDRPSHTAGENTFGS